MVPHGLEKAWFGLLGPFGYTEAQYGFGDMREPPKSGRPGWFKMRFVRNEMPSSSLI